MERVKKVTAAPVPTVPRPASIATTLSRFHGFLANMTTPKCPFVSSWSPMRILPDVGSKIDVRILSQKARDTRFELGLPSVTKFTCLSRSDRSSVATEQGSPQLWNLLASLVNPTASYRPTHHPGGLTRLHGRPLLSPERPPASWGLSANCSCPLYSGGTNRDGATTMVSAPRNRPMILPRVRHQLPILAVDTEKLTVGPRGPMPTWRRGPSFIVQHPRPTFAQRFVAVGFLP